MYESYRVLFVDDEPNILNTLRRGLADEEYFCLFANGGREALDIMRDNPIAVIVTDMRMPEMSGLELLQIVSEQYPTTVKIVLSGYTQLMQILATINQIDLYRFVTKPWKLDDLMMIVKKALDYYMVQEQNMQYRKTLEAKNQSYQNILKKINEMIDDAKSSKELLSICGKALVAYGSDFTDEEKLRFRSVLACRESIFDILVNKLTTQKKEIGTNELSVYFLDYLTSSNPSCQFDLQEGKPVRQGINIKMIETAIDVLQIIFSEEFGQHGLYCKCRQSAPFSLALASPSAEPELPATKSLPGRTMLDAKIDLAKVVLNQVMDLNGIQFQIIKAEGNMVAEILIP